MLERNLSVCDQSEYGAALGVARLAMHVDNNITDQNNIIKEIKISKEYKPKLDSIDLLKKRYTIWKDLYSSNKNIASTLLA